MVRSLLVVLLFLLFSGGSLQAQVEKRDPAHAEVTGVDSPSPQSDHEGKKKSKREKNDDPDRIELGEMAILGLLAAFLVPYEAFDNDFREGGRFARYPYRNQYPGFLWRREDPADESEAAPPPPEPKGFSCFSFRGAIEDGGDFGGVNRLGVRLTADTETRFGVTSNFNWYHESFWCGTDDFLIGDTNLTYRFAQHEQVEFYVGLGCRYMTDGRSGNAGVNVLYGCDIFPVRPVVISLLMDGGNLGDVGVFHWRATVGATWKGVEMYTGYDFMRVGSAILEGPLLGLRFWF